MPFSVLTRHRRNHPCQILCWSVERFLRGSTPKSAISYKPFGTTVTTVLHYRADCEYDAYRKPGLLLTLGWCRIRRLLFIQLYRSFILNRKAMVTDFTRVSFSFPTYDFSACPLPRRGTTVSRPISSTCKKSKMSIIYQYFADKSLNCKIIGKINKFRTCCCGNTTTLCFKKSSHL